MKSALTRVAMVWIVLALVQLTGCAVVQRDRLQEPGQERSTTGPTPPRQMPSTAEKRDEVPPSEHKPSAAPQPAPPPESRVSEPVPPPSQAVVALLDTADQRARAGNLDSAAAILERALRLEPHDPRLWHRLAKLRLQQGQFGQAASLAAKSNALAGNNRPLQASNWDTIAQAKEKLGDVDAARAARKKAHELR
jgi:Tetratricopeptide repeat